MSHPSAAQSRLGPTDVGALAPPSDTSPASGGDRIVRGIIVALLTAGLLAVLSAAWSGKADRRDVDRVEAKLDRVLDLLCAEKQNARACQ